MPVLNAITVDVEDYFHAEAMSPAAPRENWDSMPSRVEKSTRRLLEIFAANEVKATFFVLGWVAQKFPRLVREIAEHGHELACHSYWHRPVFRLSPEQFIEDTSRAKQVIEDALGSRIYGYRAPSFSMTPGTEWASAILADLGFLYDSSVNPIVHDFYGNPNASRVPTKIANDRISELPIATIRISETNLPIGGGAYLRIFPYFLSAWGIRRLNALENQPAMIYLHPWEIDDHQPRLQVGLKSRLRHYTGLAKMEVKLDRLLKQFKFGRVIDAFASSIDLPKPTAEPLQMTAAGRA